MIRNNEQDHAPGRSTEEGFSLTELVIATALLVSMAGYMFSAMADMHKASVYQGEIQTALSNVRMAAGTIEHYVTQAAFNPKGIVMEGVTITSATQVRLKADVTGSSTTDPNKGDPDGDTYDVDEDVTVRYRTAEQRLDLVLRDGTVRPVAGGISEFSMQYYDRNGSVTNVNNQVTTIQVTIGASTSRCDPQTGRRYAVRENFSFNIQSR
jgi:hypothetical protein